MYIIPSSRRLPFVLRVYLDPKTSSSDVAGELFWDDGDSIDSYEKGAFNHVVFSLAKNKLASRIVHNGYKAEPMTLGSVVFHGVSEKTSRVAVNGKAAKFSYDAKLKVRKLSLWENNFSSFRPYVQGAHGADVQRGSLPSDRSDLRLNNLISGYPYLYV